MKPAINILVTGLTLFIAVLTMVSCASTPSPPPQRIGEGEHASWAFYFDNLDDLCAHSDIIVVGTVDRVIEVIHQGRMSYQTNWAFLVEKILKGETTCGAELSKAMITGARPVQCCRLLTAASSLLEEFSGICQTG